MGNDASRDSVDDVPAPSSLDDTQAQRAGPLTWLAVALALVGIVGLVLLFEASLAGWTVGLWIGTTAFLLGVVGVGVLRRYA